MTLLMFSKWNQRSQRTKSIICILVKGYYTIMQCKAHMITIKCRVNKTTIMNGIAHLITDVCIVYDETDDHIELYHRPDYIIKYEETGTNVACHSRDYG